MKKLLLIGLIAALMGAAGFAAGRYLLQPDPDASSEAAQAKGKSVLFKMPLGKFTFQVLQPDRILHIVVDMDVYIDNVAAFERLGGAGGKARLRDSTISAVSDLSETLLWVGKGEEGNLDKQAMAEQIVLKLHAAFPSVQSAQINTFFVSDTPRP